MMTESEDGSELLFFDTFSHEDINDINLDLVQFPKPVYITQVRIIPLGARVQADFPGGVRLGATNPSKFEIDFFVNDLGIAGASTFENLGHLQYNQNDCIHLECGEGKIPTDGLVLRGWYNTITLAVYGILTNAINEAIASPTPQSCEAAVDAEAICSSAMSKRKASAQDGEGDSEWKEKKNVVVMVGDEYGDSRSDEMEYPMPRKHYHQHGSDDRDRDRRLRKVSNSSPLSMGPSTSAAARKRLLQESESNEEGYMIRNREKHARDWSRSPDYSRHSRRKRSNRSRSRSCTRTRSGSRSRSEIEEGQGHKWPRTPPVCIDSPARPRSPDTMDYDDELDDQDVDSVVDVELETPYKLKTHKYLRSEELVGSSLADRRLSEDEETTGTPIEQYEPILSDDEMIGGDEEEEPENEIEEITSNEMTKYAHEEESNGNPCSMGSAAGSGVGLLPGNGKDWELEIQKAAKEAKPIIKPFDPFTMAINKYDDEDINVHYTKELENLRILMKKFELQLSAETLQDFASEAVSGEEREKYVCLSDQLINQLTFLIQDYKRRNFVMRQFFKNSEQNLDFVFYILQVGLNYEVACLQPQPAYKIRHIKIGIKLAELLGNYGNFVSYILHMKGFNIFEVLFGLYHQQYMSLSIKLMILKAIYALLDTKIGIKFFLKCKFLNDHGPNHNEFYFDDYNGYKILVNLLQSTKLTRTKYALQAILKKLHLYEALEYIKSNCEKLFFMGNEPHSSGYSNENSGRERMKKIEQCMDEVLNALSYNCYSYLQQRRFLPVSKTFEIIADPLAKKIFSNTLQTYFRQQSLAESILLVLSNTASITRGLYMKTLDLMKALLVSHVGLDYLVDDCYETTKVLIAILLNIDDIPTDNILLNEQFNNEIKEEQKEDLGKGAESGTATRANETSDETSALSDSTKQDTQSPSRTDSGKAEQSKEPSSSPSHSNEVPASPFVSSFSLNSMQSLGFELAYKVQTRYHLDAIVYPSINNDYDCIELSNHLHALYSQLSQQPGRQHTIDVISLSINLQIFLDLIKKEQRLQAQRQLINPELKYKSPVLSYTVDIIDSIVRYCDNLTYLSENQAMILDLAKNHETFEPSVSAVLQEMFVYLKPLELVNINSYEDITPLIDIINRSLEYITTFPGDLIMSLRLLRHLCKPLKSNSLHSNHDTEQLKYRFVALQFYSADGVQILLQILERLSLYFEQPGLHKPSLMTQQGLYCCQIILTTLEILKEILTYAIQCRDVEFKDLTAIDYLMKTYYLLHYYPEKSQVINEVQLAKKEIVQILLAYTQPNEQDEESLHKSLWTLMIREILKNIEAPYSFIPGLQVLIELLPLPLPMPMPIYEASLIKEEANRLITERRLWSAHLHPQSVQISKLIEAIIPSSYPQLGDLLVRFCLQLGDLAPNLTLLITKTLTDLICQELQQANNTATNYLLRLLQVFARLSAAASLKSSALSILSGKLWDLFALLLNIQKPDALTLKCQACILRTLESFLDTQISLVSPAQQSNPAINLASALPPKELLPKIADSILSNLFNVEVQHEVGALGLRNLVILTEHDITFYHLVLMLKQKTQDFQQWLEKILVFNESTAFTSNIETLVLLFKSLLQYEDEQQALLSPPDSIFPARTLKMSIREMAQLIGYTPPSTQPSTSAASKLEPKNPIRRIVHIFEKHQSEVHQTLFSTAKHLVTLIESFSNENGHCESNDIDMDIHTMPEPLLPQAESIVTQYDGRPIFTTSHRSDDFTQLSIQTWLDPLHPSSDDYKEPPERVACDLNELATEYLSVDTNLTVDCKRVLHLSASPQSNRERTPTAPCFRTRRVEVEPTTGRPEKKVYVTPVRGRGFTRTPQSRGDLFRSRPPNTSRPPSLHVDDFQALETCGAQPTGPTGYNKIPPHIRGSRVARSRGTRLTTAPAFRKPKLIRTASPQAWAEGGSMSHYRTMAGEQHFGEPHYPMGGHFIPRGRGRGIRGRATFMR